MNERRRDLGVALFLTEASALLIAMVTPVVPGRSGSTWSPAELIWPDPTYPQKVFVGFLAVNGLVVLLALVALVSTRLRGPGE